MARRPERFHHFIGQRQPVNFVTQLAEGAREIGKPCPHLLFVGPPGYGKTSLGRAVAKEVGSECVERDEYNARFKGLSNWAGKVTEPFDVTLARGSEERGLKSAWEKHRQQHIGFAAPSHPFHLQGSADLNSYKMFAEVFWHLLRHGGRLGIILPSGIYSDSGTQDLRETLLKHDWQWLFCFENRRKIFDIDGRFKFGP